MDLGVGSFVFSVGGVAARLILKDKAISKAAPLDLNLFYFMQHALRLFVLGIIRTLGVKGLNYADYITKYGVLWNLFFALGLLPPFVAVTELFSDYTQLCGACHPPGNFSSGHSQDYQP